MPSVVFVGGYDINLDDVSFVQRLMPAPKSGKMPKGYPQEPEGVPVVIDPEDMDTEATMIMIAFKGSGQFGLPPLKGEAMRKFLEVWEKYSWNGCPRSGCQDIIPKASES